MNLKLKHHFDAAHRLETHQGLCKNVHGHRWDVEVIISKAFIDLSNGMIVDFGDIKNIINQFDHSIVLSDCSSNEQLIQVIKSMGLRLVLLGTNEPPTAENIAVRIKKEIIQYLGSHEIDYSEVEVTVWESPNAEITA